MGETAQRSDVDGLRQELLGRMDDLKSLVEGGFRETRENFRDLSKQQQEHGKTIAVLETDTRRAHARVGTVEARVEEYGKTLAILEDRDSRPGILGAAAGGGAGLFIYGLVEVLRALFRAKGAA